MKRTIMATIEVVACVELEIQDEEQIMADPEKEMSDGDAAKAATTTAIKSSDIWAFGPDYEPAQTHRLNRHQV